ALPAPWVQADVGTNQTPGSGTGAGNTFTISGSGTDIWNTIDGFHYVYQPWTGNGQIIVRVTAMQNTHAWAKAGVMFRESLNANSKEAALVVTPSNGLVFITRTSTGGSAGGSFFSGPAAPYYLKLIRSSNSISAYRSSNGTSWTKVGNS